MNELMVLLKSITESLYSLRDISKHLEAIEEQMKKYDELEARLNFIDSKPLETSGNPDWWETTGPTAL